MLFMSLLLLLASPLMSTAASEKGSSCGAPPDTKNGTPRTANKAAYSEGELVYYRCLSGYTMGQQANYVTCKDSQWTNPPICRRINQICGPPPKVLHGEIKDQKLSYPSGSSVKYECTNLYTPEGNEQITCRDGEWDKEPICREPCTVSEAVMQKNKIQQKSQEGEEKIQKYPKHSQQVTFECQPGYLISDVSRLSVQCLDGEIEYPKCLKPGQCDLPNILHGIRTPHIESGYDSGSSVDIDCEEPYALNGNRNLRCDNGRWSHLPQCLQPCRIHRRNLEDKNIELESPEDLNKIHLHGEEINIKCRLRFERPGPLKAFCDDGIMKYTKCFPDTMSLCHLNKEQLNNNFLELHEDHHNELFYTEGDMVHFKCKAGFTGMGTLTGRCGKPPNPDSEQKEPVLTYPKCERFCHINQQAMDTNFLKLPGAPKEVYAEGEVVQFACKDGFTARGDLTAPCQVTSDSTEATLTYPSCRRIGDSCGPPPIVRNGDIAEEKTNIYASGSAVTYVCAKSFILEGNDRVTCTDGEWDKEPACRGPCSVTEATLQQHNIKLKFSKRANVFVVHHDKVSFICAEGYEISDEKKLRPQCLDGVINLPRCLKKGSCSVTEATMQQHNIKPKFSKRTHLFLENEEKVSFLCLEGYEISNEKQLRPQCLEGVIKLPQCSKIA